jgi:hypothetical protein
MELLKQVEGERPLGMTRTMVPSIR